MNIAYPLPDVSLIRVKGRDSIKVLNGLCTAKLVALASGQAIEAMFTDDRGRVLAHTLIALESTETGTVWILGFVPNPEQLVAHIDRFIFREDATPQLVSSQFSVWLVDGENASQLLEGQLSASDQSFAMLTSPLTGWGCRWPVTSSQSLALWAPRESQSSVSQHLEARGYQAGSVSQFQSQRIANFWPMPVSEISERTLPQELDRDQQAISFTKGCYLGQETVARLDAMGQVQKKLCLVQLDGWTAECGTALVDGDKAVGSLTSVAPELVHGKQLALAYMKRGAMKPGSPFTVSESGATGCVISLGGTE